MIAQLSEPLSRAATPMRSLQVISSLDPALGGPSEGAGQICRALKRLGVAAEIATLDEQDAMWGSECSPVRLGPARWGTYSYSEKLRDWLRANARGYDAVIVHGLWQYLGLATWRTLRGTGTPYFVFPHGMLDPWFKREYPLKHLKKQLYWPWAEHQVLRDAQAVLFTSEEERRLARQTFERYRVNEAVIGYGILGPSGQSADLRATFMQRHPHLQDKRLLLYLGRLHPKKGCDLLIDAFATVAHRDPDLHLVMAGPDHSGYQAELTRRARGLGLGGRVSWTGLLKGEMKWGAYYSADAFVLPSHQENFGIAVAEALACGVPVLISNKVNIWREIEAAQAGIVADDTLSGTTELLHGWLDLDALARERMGRNALACFRGHFHIDAAAKNLLDTIRATACRPEQTSAA